MMNTPTEETMLTNTDIPVSDLVPQGEKCAKRIYTADEVLLCSHIDADGLTSAGIAAQALTRANVSFETKFLKQLDEKEIEKIAETEYKTVLFTDFGSGQLPEINKYASKGDFTPVISDHHEPADGSTQYHLNPLLYDIDGSSELSGAGTTYILARCMANIQDHPPTEDKNKDLSGLAIVGAVGDMQSDTDGLTGANEEIVNEAVETNVITKKKDISLYGKHTRPLPKLIEYSTDIRIPGITGSEAGALQFVKSIGIDLQTEEGDWKYWVDLNKEEQQKVVSKLIETAIEKGVPTMRVDDIVGTEYELTNEPARTSLKNVSEFSTLLNATARYERQDIGLDICLGDRNEAYQEAKRLLKNHQKNISKGVEWVSNNGVTHEDHIQWFDAGDEIKETIVGIIAGMSFGEGNVERNKPIVAFADRETQNEDDTDLQEDKELEEAKVSSRANRNLTREGVDLSQVMEKAAEHVDGGGGGHNVAAGASIPADKKEAFIKKADEIVKSQLN